MLQNPEIKKKPKYQLRPLVATAASAGRFAADSQETTSIAVGIVSVLTVHSLSP
jgi:hypothetical protein